MTGAGVQVGELCTEVMRGQVWHKRGSCSGQEMQMANGASL